MKVKTTSGLLFNEEPLVINRLSARVLGLNESIVLQQIHYWLEINRKAKINFYDNRTWSYNTYEAWQKDNFDFWSISTLKRIFKNLFDKGILLKGNYNPHKYDRKLWVSIDYDKLDTLLEEYNNSKSEENVEVSTECQNDTIESFNKVSKWNYAKCQNDTNQNIKMIPTIAETTREIEEISFTTTSENKSLVVKDTNKELIEANTHLLLDSTYKRNKVKKWETRRLEKSIAIFLKRGGEYFSLLEKIYKDDKNFKPKHNRSHNVNNTFSKYSDEELEQLLFESQRNKFN